MFASDSWCLVLEMGEGTEKGLKKVKGDGIGEKLQIENENDFGENLKFEIRRNQKEKKKEKDPALESHETRWVLFKSGGAVFFILPFLFVFM